ncbi:MULTISPECIES: hypothetical protein [unclassified Sphingobium]|uniref:hypothetical protein n=1 Tax=unclassified Sphingobium TaxID=2611147 RepID=UPI0035A70F89
MTKTHILLLAGASLISLSTLANAQPRVIYSSGGLAKDAALSGPQSTTGGTTQVALDDGSLLSFTGAAAFEVTGANEVLVTGGALTARAGAGGVTVRTPAGATMRLSGANAAASLRVDGGQVSGMPMAGRLSVSSNGATRNFTAGSAFRADGDSAPRAAVTAGAQPVSSPGVGGMLIDQPTTLAQVMNNAALITGNGGAAGLPIVDNPLLPRYPQAGVADLLERAYADSRIDFPAASQALKDVYLPYLRSGGTPGGFNATLAANASATLLQYLRRGGEGPYQGPPQALADAYLAYLKAAGLPATTDEGTRALIQSYQALVQAAAGKAFAFSGEGVADSVEAYVRYLAEGGDATAYALSPALVSAYFGYIQSLGLDDQVAEAVRAQIAAYQALAQAGATNFSATSAAEGLATYLDYLKQGGISADYSAVSAAILQAWLTYVRALGLPDGLDGDLRKLLEDYFAYLDDGGEFGKLPDTLEPPPPPPPPPPAGKGIGASTSIKAPTAVAFAGPGDPGVPLVALDASGHPTTLDYFGAPGTASLTDFQSGDGWIMGRFTNGTFGKPGDNRSYAGDDGVHFASQLPVTNLPTTGTATYTLAAFTAPTFVNGGRSLLNPQVTMKLGVTFGAKETFGFEGRVAGLFNGAQSSFDFATPGGGAKGVGAAPNNSLRYDGTLGLFGSAPVTASSGNFCSPLDACNVLANFIAGGEGAATFAVAWGLQATATKKSILHGAGILTKDGTSTPPTPPNPDAAGDAPFGKPLMLTAQGVGLNLGVNATADIIGNKAGELAGWSTDTGNKPWAERGTATDVQKGGIAGVIGWSRWAGGKVTLTGNSTTLGANQSVHNIWGQAATNVPTSGTATYKLVAATQPTSDAGAAAPGTFTGSFGVDFAGRKVGWDATIDFGGQSYAYSTSGGISAPSVNLQADNSFVGSANISGTNPGRGYGFLAGPGASYVGFSYFMNVGTDRVTGVAAFGKN